MLSVVIATENSERALVPTLAALVPGATAGLVAEVILADAGSTDATAEVADFAGCRMHGSAAPLGARLAEAAALARAPWLLFLSPGNVPQGSWIDETTRFIEQASQRAQADTVAAVFRPAPPVYVPASPLREAASLLAQALGLARQRMQGLLIEKRHYGRIGGHGTTAADPHADILRRLGRRQVVVLRCGATAG
jgi:hypothetical protein